MKRIAMGTVLGAAFLLSACTSIWAQVVSRQVVSNLMDLESYHGRIVERYMVVGQEDAPLVKDVIYQKPWKVRAEIIEPAERAGDLYLYDGETVTMWWPRDLFAIRVRGLTPPDEKAIRAHVERESLAALKAYAYSLEGVYPVAGEKADRWRVIPTRNEPYRFTHTAWMDKKYSFPLKMDFYTPQDRHWYAMEFQSIEIGVPVAPDAFSLELPENAVVFDWDMTVEGIDLEEARRKMNFTVRMPKYLPEGHKVRKIIRNQHCLPMVALLMDRGASWISMTENRAPAETLKMPIGKEIPLNGTTAYLNFMGTYSVISWIRDGTQLTLIGNMAFPEMIRIAASVE